MKRIKEEQTELIINKPEEQIPEPVPIVPEPKPEPKKEKKEKRRRSKKDQIINVDNLKKAIFPSLRKEKEKEKEKPHIKSPESKKGMVLAAELWKIKKDQQLFYFDYKKAFKWYSFKYQWAKYKEKNMRRKLYLIIMHLRNDKYDFFYVATNNAYFEYKEGLYHIDPDMVREDTHSKLSTLYYNQDISTPFKINFDLDELHTQIQKEGDVTVDKALNPFSLKAFINSQVIEKVLKGQELSDELKLIKILIIILLLLTVIGLIMTARANGWI